MLQIQHQPQPQVQAAPTGPTQNPLLFLSQQQSPSPPPSSVFPSSSIFDTPAPSILQSKPQQAPVALQPGLWKQGHDISSTGCLSTLSPVASAAYLLEARLHISQQAQPHPPASLQQQQQGAFPIMSRPVMWNSAPSTDPDMQELGLAAQQQLSSCVMVK